MINYIWIIALSFLFIELHSQSEKGLDDLADKIQNPFASLISVPFQNNMDFDVGPFDRTRNTLNIQPVIPFKLSEDII